ncbi:MAG TPA: MgtC/SapB family protein [Pirellulales bacterium]|jgi:putative Mg2+ transporter-C (MgtC) family protein|nr:MgtC/SapB family protein [Pirellulales bacterium]
MPPAPDLFTFSWHLVVAMVLGSLLGLDRQLQHHPAGLRTNALVCSGSALFVSLSLLMQETASPTRMAAYIISGIGFLAGGVILREGLNVRGMNTAATLWCSSAIGVLVGSGYPQYGAVGTFFVLGLHLTIRPLDRWMENRTRTALNVETYYHLTIVCDEASDSEVRRELLQQVTCSTKMFVQGISSKDLDSHGDKQILADIYAVERVDHDLQEIINHFTVEEGVRSISWKKIQPL